MKVTALVLSNSSDNDKYEITKQTIKTLYESDGWGDNEIIVVETQSEVYLNDNNFKYENCTVVFPDFEFSYNKYLNFGLSKIKTLPEWILVCNNDLLFDVKWLKEMERVISHDSGILSLSPIFPEWHLHKNKNDGDYELGYNVSEHVCGWCILVNYDKVIKKLNLFDERFEFYYQDNDYALTLESENIKHALCYKSKVDHLISMSKDLIVHKENYYWTTQRELLRKKWNV